MTQAQLTQLLIHYEDVFARDEFDLGNFTGIQHIINIGTAKPIKQRMRRTPVCFASEEEAYQQKWLKLELYKTMSDWASAPVLILNKMGQ